MKKNNRRFIALAINAVLLLLLFILRYSGLVTLAIGQAVPITLIPFVVAIALFWGEWLGAFTGFIAGALMDGSMNGSSCFNTLALMLIGLICGVLSSYYMNKNIRTAACLSLGSAFVYLFARLLFFYSFREISVGTEYFSNYFIPTVFYTAVFILPFYYLQRKLKDI